MKQASRDDAARDGGVDDDDGEDIAAMQGLDVLAASLHVSSARARPPSLATDELVLI